MKTLRNNWPSLLAATAIVLLSGCANLDAVRQFSASSATLNAYPDAGRAFVESGVSASVLKGGAQPPAADRQRQVNEAMQLQAAVSAYFSVMAQLAGENAFALDAEIDQVAAGLSGLPSVSSENKAAISDAAGLIKILASYATAGAQQEAVKRLIGQGGPPAMRIVGRLERIADDWSSVVQQDGKSLGSTTELLASATNAGEALSLLLRDRQLAYATETSVRLNRIAAVQAGLKSVQAGHKAMEEQLNQLDDKQLQATLKKLASDLKKVGAQIESLR